MQFTRNNDAHASDIRGIFAAYPRGEESPIPWTPETPIFAFLENFADLKKRQDGIIDIPAYPLEVEFTIPKNRLPRPKNSRPTLIVINSQPLPLKNPKMSMFFSSSSYKLETDQDSFKINQAGVGLYSVHVQAPGCAIYSQTKPTAVTEGQQIQVKLEPGFQLKYSLNSKNVDDYSVSLMRRIRNEKGLGEWEYIPEFDQSWEFNNWEHLSPGKYQLAVYDLRNSSVNPSKTDFEIKPDDPEIVDLGEIEVSR